MYVNIGTEMFIGQFLIHWTHMRAYYTKNRLAWTKCQKTIHTGTRLHRNKTRSTGRVGKGLFPLFGTADAETERVVTPWRFQGGGEISTQAYHLQRDGLLYKMPVQVPLFCWGPFIMVTFYDMSDERFLLLPISSMGTLLLDLRSEAGYTLPLSGALAYQNYLNKI